MPPRISRRAVAVERPPTQTHPPTQTQPTDPPSDEDMDTSQTTGSNSVEQLAKGLVRYALACEYARKPIKRQEVNERVLGSRARLFRAVFEQANSELMDVFGMTLVELPRGERITARQKRVAGAESQSKTSNMWVLQTILPEQYRDSEAIGPSRRAARVEDDRAAAYVGLYSMVLALIIIVGGRLAENKLDRALKRMNANQTTPVDTTDKTLAAMVKDGYVVKVREAVNGDETVDYVVGPRGKVEVGREGFAALIRTIYGEDEGGEELEVKIRRTLDVAGATSGGVSGTTSGGVSGTTSGGVSGTTSGGVSGTTSGGGVGDEAVAGGGRKRGRPRREDGDEEEEEEEEEDEEYEE